MKILQTLWVVAAIAGLSWGQVYAGEPVAISAKATHKPDKFYPTYQDDKAGRIAYTSSSWAVDREITKTGIVADKRWCQGSWDMTGGAGGGHGYCKAEKGGDTVQLQWNGMCDTLTDKDGKPQTRCGGGWVYVPGSGTGRYAGIRGNGAWWGLGTADGGFEEEWNGYYQK